MTALVGPSGAGKSTIIGLIAAFYVPTGGRVLVDGVDLAKVRLDSYRTQLGVVLQETFLFDGTIRENVAFSRPNATEEEILAACRIARVDEFAEGFEKKYDTVVGERGVKLSGGQRQRVSIARAILADPRILILDEATSSLDSESEALIQEGLALPDARPHHVCDRAPAVDDSPRRSDSGGRGRADHRARHARVAVRARAGATTISTPSSTAWNRICFSRPAKAAMDQRMGKMRMAPRQGAGLAAGRQRKLRHCQKQFV